MRSPGAEAQPLRRQLQRLAPIGFAQPAVAADVRAVEPAPAQPVDGVAGLVRDPLLVDRLVEPRQHAQHLPVARIEADAAADRVRHVDRFGLGQLPRPGEEGVGLRGQGADRAQIDDVGRQLRAQRPLDIGADLHVLAAPGGPELLHPGNFGQKADAARAVDAARHVGLDQRAEILVADRALALLEPAAVEAVGHRLVLQVALAALVADRAVERMVDQQELHDPVARLDRLGRIRMDDHAVAHRHRARRNRLWRALHLHEAHPAVAGDLQALVEAEMRDLDPGLLAGLQDRGPGRHLDFVAVDGQLRHFGIPAIRSRPLAVEARLTRSRPTAGVAAASGLQQYARGAARRARSPTTKPRRLPRSRG